MSRVAAGGDVDPLPVVAELEEAVVALPGIGSDRGAREGGIAHECGETVTADVGNLAKPHPAKAFRFDQFHGDHDNRLGIGLAPSHALLSAANVTLVDLNRAGEPIASGTDHGRPEAMQHRPSRLVGAEAQQPLQGLCRNAVLRGGDMPRCREPDREGRTRAVKNGSCCHRDPRLALRAPEPPVAHPPPARRPASRTLEAVRPSQPFEIIEAGRIVRKPL